MAGTMAARAYADGFSDGVAETLAQIDGEGAVPGTIRYAGPVPPELTAWIAGVRDNMGKVDHRAVAEEVLAERR